MTNFTLEYEEQPSVALEFVEAKIKPETVGHVTPKYSAQTVYPAAGTTFGRVDVDAIPDPTAVKEIDTNGDHDVRRYGTARVNVQPTLQTKEVTPTKQTQTVTADTGYDGLESVEVEPIPSEYIVPTGTLNITQNGVQDVTDKAAVNVNVPIPPEYIIPAGTKTITENGTGIDVREYERVDVGVVPEISGGYFRLQRTRITYTGNDLTNANYITTANALKSSLQSPYSVFAFEVISDSFDEGDWVTGFYGVDSYGFRAYYWLYEGGKAVRHYTNYQQNIAGNLHNGAVVDVYYVQYFS